MATRNTAVGSDMYERCEANHDTYSDACLGHGGDGRQVRRHDTRAGGPSQGAVDCGREVRPQVTEPGGGGVQASDASLGHRHEGGGE